MHHQQNTIGKERISGSEYVIEEIDKSIKENAKSKKLQTQNVQEIWGTMKSTNIEILGIEEGEQSHLKT